MNTQLKENSSFYPTPSSIITKMWYKVPEDDRAKINYILEPSAGAGDIIEKIKDTYRHSHPTIHAIEKDESLTAMLKGKGIPVIDRDFLTFSGPDKYDLIIANPPFDQGDLHLLKAIDIMYCGNIVFLLNAETLNNPHTNTRKQLTRKLEELNADIEFLDMPFLEPGTPRKTSVNVALIHIRIERDIEDDLFEGVTDAPETEVDDLHGPRELTEKDSIRNVVADYNRTVTIGTQTLLDFYKSYSHVSPFLGLTVGDEKNDHYWRDDSTLTATMKTKINQMLALIRRHYWQKILTFENVKRRMTAKRLDEFQHKLNENEHMDFTESNIRQFILNLIGSYESILIDAVMEIFENMTSKYAWDEDLHNQNVHYFNGWKTNQAYYVNKKVILPYYKFTGWSGEWSVDYDSVRKLHDIDIVMSYFDAEATHYMSIVDALTHAFKYDKTRKVTSTFFEISVYKKGTCHLTFRDPDILRRFNVTACKGKNWLPQDYGNKHYKNMTTEEQHIVDSFEGEETYTPNVQPGNLFQTKGYEQIEFNSAA